MKFRKKPAVIEAEQFHANWDGLRIPGVCAKPECHMMGPHVHTIDGTLRISDGDWIIKGVKGEFYPCKPDIFEQTYEQVEALAAKERNAS